MTKDIGLTMLDEIKRILNTTTAYEAQSRIHKRAKYSLHLGRHTGKWFGQFIDSDGEVWQTPMCETENEAERVTCTMMGLPPPEMKQDSEGWW